MDPPILFWVLANDFFEAGVVPFRQLFDARDRLRQMQRVDHTGATHLEAKWFLKASAVKHELRRSANQCEYGGRFVTRCWPTEELHPAPFGTRMLVAQNRQLSAAAENTVDQLRAAVTGDNMTSGVKSQHNENH